MSARLRRIAITATLAVIVAITIPIFVHRRDFDVAVFRWTRNQSAENAAALATERAENYRVQLRSEIAVAFVVFVGLNAGLFLRDRLKRQFT